MILRSVKTYDDKVPGDLQREVGSVEYLLHVEDIGDDPGVFGEGAQGQRVLPNKCSRGVRKSLLLGPHGYSLPKTVEEHLRGVKD